MADIKFLEAGTSASRGLEFFNSIALAGSAAITCDSAVTISSTRSLKVVVGAGENAQAIVRNAMADAGRRISFLFRTPSSLGDNNFIFGLGEGLSLNPFLIEITAAGALKLTTGASTKSSSTGLFTTSTNYIIQCGYAITSASNYSIKFYAAQVGSTPTLILTVTNADFSLSNTGATSFFVGGGSGGGGAATQYFDCLYVDDGTDQSSPGEMYVTPKLLAADSSVNWDTSVGSDPGAGSRYQQLDDRPWSTSTGRQQAASTQAAEDYTLQASSVGDVDLSSKTVVGMGVYAYAKDGSSAGVVPALRGAAVVPSGNPTTSATGTIPATVAANDIGIVMVTSRDSTGAGTLSVTDNEGAGSWVKFANSTDHKATWWWKRASGNTNSKTLSVNNAVGSCSFVMKWFSSCVTSGDPFTNVVVETNSSADETHASFTPTNAYSMVLAGVHNYNNDNAVTSLAFATLGATTMTEKLSTGGSDCACAFGHVAQNSAATATGALTWAQTDGTTYSITCALIAANTGVASDGTPQLRIDGSDVAAIDLNDVTRAFSAFRTSSSYPSTVGIKSTGTATDTFAYELGAHIAYTPSSNPTGTLNKTLDAATSTATGTLAIAGEASPTLAAVSPSATGTVAVVGTLAKTLDDATLAAAGNCPAAGTLAQTLDVATVSASGVSPIAGAASPILDAATASSAGTVDVAGTAAPTLGAVASTGTGAVDVVGQSSSTLEAASASSAGTVEARGTLAQTLDTLTSAAEGLVTDPTISGELAQTLGASTAAGAGAVAVAGQAAPTLDALSGNASGQVAIAGAEATTLDAVTLSGAGSTETHGLAAPTLDAVTLGAIGAVSILGTAGRVLGDASVSAVGDVDTSGELARSLGTLTGSGAGAVSITGSLAKSLDAAGLAATGVGGAVSDGQLAATLEPLTVVAEGLVSGFVTPVIDVSIFRAAALAKERRRRAGSTAEVVVTTEGHGTTKHEPVAVGAMGAGQRQASGGSVAEMALDLSGRAALVRSGGAEAPAVNVLVDAVPGEAIDVETLVGLLYDSLDDGLRTVVLCPAEFS